MDHTTATTPRSRYRTYWVVAGSLFVVLIPMALLLGPVFMSQPFGENDEPREFESASIFFHLTGWELPDDAKVLTNVNTHSGFKNDGDFTLVVRLSPAKLQLLVENDSNIWSDCPIAPEIAERTFKLPEHSGELYYAKKTSDSDADWHRGYVVIVNRETGMIWIYEWKV